MNKGNTSDVPLPTLMEALQERFDDWSKLHRLHRSGREEVGGNATDNEPYRFTAGRSINPKHRSYSVRGESRQGKEFFHFEISPSGTITNQIQGHDNEAQKFRDWLMSDLQDKRIQAATEAARAEFVEQFQKDLHRTFGGHASTADAEEHSRIMAISA